MKLTAILILLATFQVCGRSFGQTVTLKGKDIPLEKIFRSIEQQSHCIFFYREDDLAGLPPVTVALKETPLATALEKVFSGQPLEYEMVGRTIFITRMAKPAAVAGKAAAALLPLLIDVRGIVKDSTGTPLAGASVKIRGSSRGTTTDAKGAFTLKADPGDALIISFVGFADREIRAGTEEMLIVLKASGSQLDEVQMIAYGTTTRRLTTGSITTVTSEEISRQPVNNPLYALQGRVPGLTITPSTGLAGGPVDIQLRGNNSLSFTTSPLIVVDGLPIANNIAGLSGPGALRTKISALNFLNPGDIESIDVLKDADATSIYGSRGANGVILITTKKGKAGKSEVNINAQTGFGQVERKLKLLKTPRYLQLRRQIYAMAGVDFVNTFPYGNPDLKYGFAADLNLWDTTRDIDMQKELIGKAARYNDVQASMTGGNSTVQYVIGGNFHQETTVFRTPFDDRKASVHLSLTGITPDKKLRTTVNASYMTDRNLLPEDDMTMWITRLAPNTPAFFQPDGSLNFALDPNGNTTMANPYQFTKNSSRAVVNNLLASASIAYQPMAGLFINAQLSYNSTIGNSNKLFPIAAFPASWASFVTGTSQWFQSNVKNVNFEPQISYKRQLGQSGISILAGATIQSTETTTLIIAGDGYTSDALLQSLRSAKTIGASNTSTQYKYSGVFARAQYDWSHKYLLSLNARRDGSSRFGPGRQFGNFGSAAIAWIFSSEPFMDHLMPYLNFGKIRFSYGTSGNDGISDYAYFQRFSAIRSFVGYQDGSPGLRTSGIYNADYHWESTRKMELGLDLGFLKDRILLFANAFINRSGNQLVNLPLPSFAGPGSAVTNLPAIVQNTGIELTLSTVNVRTKSFTWSSSINFTRNRNKLVAFPDLERTGYYSSLKIGKPFFGMQQVFQDAGVDPATGNWQFRDVDGKIVSDPTNINRLDGGRYVQVNVLPKFYGAISNALTYKGWRLDFLFDFSKITGANPILGMLDYFTSLQAGPSNVPVEILDHWEKPGDKAELPRLAAFADNDVGNQPAWARSSTLAFVDASYIKLRNLSLSYTLPAALAKKMRLQNLRCYLQGQNLLTITGYKGLDPQTQSFENLPTLRVTTVGVQVMF